MAIAWRSSRERRRECKKGEILPAKVEWNLSGFMVHVDDLLLFGRTSVSDGGGERLSPLWRQMCLLQQREKLFIMGFQY